MERSDAEIATLVVLVSRVRDALADSDDLLAAAALQAILDDLQGGGLAVQAARLSAAVRSELLGESAKEWLTRLLLRCEPAASELAGQILDAIASSNPLDEVGDEVEASPIVIGGQTFHLVPAHSSDPDWTMADGRTVWGGSILAKLVVEGHINVEGKRVLELGCGLGVVGLACAQAGAKEALLTDIDIGLLRAVDCTVRLNGFSEVLRTARLDWTYILKVTQLSEIFEQQDVSSHVPFDIILGADIIYEEAHATVLLSVIQRVLGENFASEVVFAIGLSQYREGAAAFASLLGVCKDKLKDTGCDAGCCQGDATVHWTVESASGGNQKSGRDFWVYRLRSAPWDNKSPQ